MNITRDLIQELYEVGLSCKRCGWSDDRQLWSTEKESIRVRNLLALGNILSVPESDEKHDPESLINPVDWLKIRVNDMEEGIDGYKARLHKLNQQNKELTRKYNELREAAGQCPIVRALL